MFDSHPFCSCSFEVLLSILSVTLIDLFFAFEVVHPVLDSFSLPSICVSLHVTLRRGGGGGSGLSVIMKVAVTI